MGLCYDIALIFSFEKNNFKSSEIEIIAEIVGIKIEKEYYDKYEIKVLQCENDDNFVYKKLIVYVDYNENLIPGDIIKIKGEFQRPSINRNYKGFNYSNYLKQRKIYGTIFANDVKIIRNKTNNSIIEKIRYYLNEQIKLIYDRNSYTFLTGMLLGNTEEIDMQLEDYFKKSNLSHIIAISGSHLVYVIIVCEFILDIFVKSKKIKNYLLILILFCFFALTGKNVSCLRACIMSCMMFISSNIYRKSNFYLNCIISFIIIIILNPYNICNIGMYLSYAGTIGIVLFYKLFCRIVEIKVQNKIFIHVSKIALISVSAQVLIVPIMLYSFNNLSFNFVISNLLVSFFVGPVLILGYISVLISFLFPKFKLLINIEKIVIKIIFFIAEICSKMPFSNIYVCTPNLFSIFIYYFTILAMCIFFRYRKIYVLKILISFDFLKFEIKKILLNTYFLKIISAVIIVLILNNCFNKNFDFKMHFIDVGQGDCSLIITPTGKRLIIDAGEGENSGYDYGKNVVLPYLLDKGINKIDYIIVSHCDSDHIGGIYYILENVEVEKILIGVQPENSENLMKLIDISKKEKIEIITLEMGDKYKIDEEIIIEVVWPSSENIIEENALNNNSLVFKLIYNDFSILFTGDIEEIAERKILDKYEGVLESDILKVAHHGSKTSSSKEFLAKVKPRGVLIGVGDKNKFGHPNKEVLKRIKENTFQIYRTDINGEIVIIVNKMGEIFIDTNI